MARPLYTAPPASVYIVMACVASTLPDQPAIIPPSPSKINAAAADFPALVTTKSAVPLKTMPVGSNVTPVPLAAKLTASGAACG